MFKEAINKTKRQPNKWEKISADDMTDKCLISKYTNSSYKSMTKKIKQPNQKMGRRPKWTVLQRRHIDG